MVLRFEGRLELFVNETGGVCQIPMELDIFVWRRVFKKDRPFASENSPGRD